MNSFPDTRLSLILRLPKNSASARIDQRAWSEFAEVYAPLLYRFARRRGLQDSDAHELVQRVMLSVSQAIERWQPEAGGPRFRNWLFTIARNHMLNLLRSNARAAVAEDIQQPLDTLPDARLTSVDAALDGDFRREAFLWAAARVRRQVAEATWLAFWKTAVDGIACSEAASQLGISIGSVYAARSRMLARIKSEVELFTQDVDSSQAGAEA